MMLSKTEFFKKGIRAISFALCLALLFSTVAFAETTTEESTGSDISSEAVSVTDEDGNTITATTDPNASSTAVVASTTVEPTTDDTLSKLQDEYDKLEDEIKQNEEKLSNVKEDMTDQKQVVSSIYSKISNTQSQINILSTRVNVLSSSIKSTNATITQITEDIGTLDEKMAATGVAIDEKNLELNEVYELLKQRLRAMYMAGAGSTLEFLLTSKDFSTLMTRAELLKRVAEHDNNMLAMIDSDLEQLSQLRDDLVTQKTESEQKKSDLVTKTQSLEAQKNDSKASAQNLENKRSEISKQYDEANKQLQSLDKTSAEYIELIKKQEAEKEKLSAEMEEFIKNNASSGDIADEDEKKTDAAGDTVDDGNPYVDANTPLSPKGMVFPVKISKCRISSPYGYRTHPTTGQYKLHTGVDFASSGESIKLKPILAAKGGKIIYASWNGGYGNFIVVDHGNNLTTCYAHCETILVSVGQMVKQGQTIGKVGTTGNSTGYHLHYEVRVNGKTTDPIAGGYAVLPG